MSTRQKRVSFLDRLIVPAFCILLGIYFTHHALSGRYGLASQNELQEQAVHLEYKLAGLKAKRSQLHNRVSLLRVGNLEHDMLDEQARYHLNLLQPDEFVIMR